MNPFDPLLPDAAAKRAEDIGVAKATKKPLTAFILAMTAGLFIAIAFTYYVTVTISAVGPYAGLVKVVGALAFSTGIILVVICGGELFTSTVLTTIAYASKRVTTRQLLKNWGIVYLGNFCGAIFFLILLWIAKQHFLSDGAWGVNAMKIAQHKIHHSFGQAVVLGTLCNLMVCLAIWMTFSCRTVTDKIVAMLFPITMFVVSGFEHSIANMFMIPYGIAIAQFAPPEFWAAAGVEASQFADLTVSNFIFKNLIPVTIGNILGGGFLVGLTYWAIYLRGNKSSEDQA